MIDLPSRTRVRPILHAIRRELLVVLIGAVLVPEARAQVTTPPDTPLGAHAMLFFDTPWAADMALFHQAGAEGASSVRLDIFMPQITSGDSQRDWSWVQRVALLARRYRMPILADLTGMPLWMGNCPAGQLWDEIDRCPARDPGTWGALAGEIATRLRGVPVSYEIWNEPDGAWTFQGTPEQYGALLAAAVSAIHRADPQAPITNGGMMTPAAESGATWLDAALSSAGASVWRSLSMLNVHIRGPENTLAGQLQAWRAFADTHGRPGIPIWITEAGYPADPAYQTDPAYRGGPGAQARYLAAALRELHRAGAAKIFVTQRDMAASQGSFASEGVLAGLADPIAPDPHVIRRPAFYACRAFALRSLARSVRRG